MKKMIVLLPLVFLGACATGGPVADSCPATGILRAAEHVTAGGVEAGIRNFRGACRPSQAGGLDVELEIDFSALAGPETRDIKLPYFVAILSPDDEIIQKLTFEMETDLNAKGESLVTESHDIHIPATTNNESGGGAAEAALYRIAIGYILTPEQQAFESRKRDVPQP